MNNGASALGSGAHALLKDKGGVHTFLARWEHVANYIRSDDHIGGQT
jgi:hypothetical protein